MKIFDIKNINFKSQMLNKYIQAQNSTNNPMQNQTSLTIGSFNQFTYQSDKTNVDAPEFIIEKTTLLNNIVFLADNNSSDKPKMIFSMFPVDEKGIKPAAFEILNEILFNQSLQTRENKSAFSIIDYINGELQCDINSDETEFFKTLNNSIDTILHPDFSNENFIKAKSSLIEKIKAYQFSSDKEPMEIFFPKKYPNIDELEQISLDDVKKAHKNIIENSQMRVCLSSTNAFYKENKDKIIQIFEKSFSKMKQETEIKNANRIKPIDKDYRIEVLSGSDELSILKFYVVSGESSYRKEIETSILAKLIKNRIKDFMPKDYDYTLIVDKSTFVEDDYLEIYLSSKDKKYQGNEIEKRINDSIKSLTNISITPTEFKKAKEEAAKEISTFYKDSFNRAAILMQNYSDGVANISKTNKFLNEITLDKMTKFATKHLSKPSSTEVKNF